MASPFWTIARFDFARRLRMVSTWVYAVLYAVVAGLWMAAAGGAISGAGVSFGGDKLYANAKAFLDNVTSNKPASIKGALVKGIAVSTTMGPGIKVDPTRTKDLVETEAASAA